MHIEKTSEEQRQDLESELRHILTKIEVKSSVREYSKEKVAHYMTLTERLGIELRELESRRIEVETQLRRLNLQAVH